ncbi:carbohydrate porin [Caulobacter sp. CCNWLY153]|uniref:carbohydrate porin n=1 Tax=unclassified Caulobacter TaxID=2648921 RepID=UPI002FF00992
MSRILMLAASMLAPSVLAIAGVAQAAEALSPSPNGAPQDWKVRSTLTGDWGGLRSRLKAKGVTLAAGYASESAMTMSGGREGGGVGGYTQELNARAVLDMGKLAGIEGGVVNFAVEERTGRNLSAEGIGNLFMVQELYGAGMDFRISELTWAQAVAGDRFNLKAGLMHTGDDFASSALNCNFQNFAFCPRSPALLFNSGFSGYPAPRWGLRARLRPAKDWTFIAGIYEVDAYRVLENKGWNLAIDSNGVLVPVEIGWTKPDKGDAKGLGGLPGFYHVGGYYETAERSNVYSDAVGRSYVLNGTRPVLEDSRWGAWAMGEQMVWRKGGASLSVFANALMFDRSTARYSRFYSAGLVRTAPFSARPKDKLGVAVAYARVNPRLEAAQREQAGLTGNSSGVQTSESSLEAFYAAQATGWLVVRPNIQFIRRPGATGTIPDAWVSGLTLRAAF